MAAGRASCSIGLCLSACQLSLLHIKGQGAESGPDQLSLPGSKGIHKLPSNSPLPSHCRHEPCPQTSSNCLEHPTRGKAIIEV